MTDIAGLIERLNGIDSLCEEVVQQTEIYNLATDAAEAIAAQQATIAELE